jgi:hypothetical protein
MTGPHSHRGGRRQIHRERRVEGDGGQLADAVLALPLTVRGITEALSVSKHLPEPEESGFAILAGHVIDRPAMAKAIAQLG